MTTRATWSVSRRVADPRVSCGGSSVTTSARYAARLVAVRRASVLRDSWAVSAALVALIR